MNKHISALSISVAFLILMCACTNPASTAGTTAPASGGNTVTFQDRTLQGTFNGKSYTLVSGYAQKDAFESGTYSLMLYNVAYSGTYPWSLGSYPMFSVYLEVMTTIPAQVGKTDLFINYSTGKSRTVTFYDSDTSMNIIACTGAVEITEIDSVNGILKGRIAASFGTSDSVNGNFTVPIEP